MINEELNINMNGLNLDSLTTDLNSSIDVDLNIMADDEANLDIENLDLNGETNIEDIDNKYQEMSIKDLQNKIKEISETKDIKISLSGNKTKLIQRIIENE